jgi:pimeloyl-ACP methyl ester carboxylesterase
MNVPAFFGSSQHPLYGVYHPPTSRRLGSTGVLICGPIGLESLRSHWMLRHLADQLASKGIPAFRFDYSGTGDSWGHHRDASLGRWLLDVETAAEELLDSAGVRKLSAIGLRFGALLAAEAARMVVPLEHLVLLDPVVTGRRYLHELRTLRDEKLARWKKQRGPCVKGDEEEILGFNFPRRLIQEIEALDLRGELPQVKGKVALYSSYEDQGIVELGAQCDVFQPLDDATDWDRVEEAERALLATALPRAAIEMLTGSKK